MSGQQNLETNLVQNRHEALSGLDPSLYPNLSPEQRKLVTNEVRPLLDARVELDNNPVTEAMYRDPSLVTQAEEKAAVSMEHGTRHLKLAGEIFKIADSNPADVIPGRVLNPQKAAAMARAEYPHQIKARRLFSNTKKHLARAERASRVAAQDYDDGLYDPAASYTTLFYGPKSRGLK